MDVQFSDYMLVKEAARTWGVSERRVVMYIGEGQIPGAIKTGNVWLIPQDAAKPADRRRVAKPPQKSLSSDLAELVAATATYLPRNNPDAILDAAPDKWLRLFGESFFAYMRGDYEQVKRCFQRAEGDDAAKLRLCSTVIAAAIGAGDYPLFREIEAYCKAISSANLGANVTAAAQCALATAYVGALAPNMVPDWFNNGDFSALPALLRPEVICLQARYFHYLKKYESVLDVARTVLAFDEPERGISYSSFYLRNMCAAACCSLGRLDEAVKYLSEALSICLPHGFITPFAETAPLHGGLLEQLLEREYPAHYDAVIGQSKRTVKNWLDFHNHFTKENITLILSPRDYEIALLAAQGKSFKKIAEQFHVSPGTINNSIQIIYQKLFISGKRELSDCIL